MKMKAVRIQLDGGLEARPVAMLVQVASQHDSTVYLETEAWTPERWLLLSQTERMRRTLWRILQNI